MANKKINMLQMVNGLAIGGAELKLLELIESLIEKDKYNITVCVVGQGGPLLDDFEKLGVKVIVFEKKFSFDFSLLFKVVRLMRQEKIEIVQTTLFYADVIGALAAWWCKVPIVVSWEVGEHIHKPHQVLAYKLVKEKFNRVVAVSEAIRKQIIKEKSLRPKQVVTIRYGVDLVKYAPQKKLTRKELGIADDSVILGTVARFTDQKGHKYLISAAEKIVKKFPNVVFVFVGDGPNRADMEKQIEELNLKDNFRLLGFRDDVVALLDKFDVFVLPSLYEGLPNVVLEAMACSLPIIATSVDGTVEAVDENVTGHIVPSKNPDKLAEAIIHLLSQNGRMKEMGLSARKCVEERFTLERQMREFEDLFEGLITTTKLQLSGRTS